MKNQFIGENNLNKRNNINLISKENIQYKDKSFKSNSTNNLFEIPENKKQNSDLKLKKKKKKHFKKIHQILWIY